MYNTYLEKQHGRKRRRFGPPRPIVTIVAIGDVGPPLRISLSANRTIPGDPRSTLEYEFHIRTPYDTEIVFPFSPIRVAVSEVDQLGTYSSYVVVRETRFDGTVVEARSGNAITVLAIPTGPVTPTANLVLSSTRDDITGLVTVTMDASGSTTQPTLGTPRYVFSWVPNDSDINFRPFTRPNPTEEWALPVSTTSDVIRSTDCVFGGVLQDRYTGTVTVTQDGRTDTATAVLLIDEPTLLMTGSSGDCVTGLTADSSLGLSVNTARYTYVVEALRWYNRGYINLADPNPPAVIPEETRVRLLEEFLGGATVESRTVIDAGSLPQTRVEPPDWNFDDPPVDDPPVYDPPVAVIPPLPVTITGTGAFQTTTGIDPDGPPTTWETVMDHVQSGTNYFWRLEFRRTFDVDVRIRAPDLTLSTRTTTTNTKPQDIYIVAGGAILGITDPNSIPPLDTLTNILIVTPGPEDESTIPRRLYRDPITLSYDHLPPNYSLVDTYRSWTIDGPSDSPTPTEFVPFERKVLPGPTQADGVTRDFSSGWYYITLQTSILDETGTEVLVLDAPPVRIARFEPTVARIAFAGYDVASTADPNRITYNIRLQNHRDGRSDLAYQTDLSRHELVVRATWADQYDPATHPIPPNARSPTSDAAYAAVYAAVYDERTFPITQPWNGRDELEFVIPDETINVSYTALTVEYRIWDVANGVERGPFTDTTGPFLVQTPPTFDLRAYCIPEVSPFFTFEDNIGYIQLSGFARDATTVPRGSTVVSRTWSTTDPNIVLFPNLVDGTTCRVETADDVSETPRVVFPLTLTVTTTRPRVSASDSSTESTVSYTLPRAIMRAGGGTTTNPPEPPRVITIQDTSSVDSWGTNPLVQYYMVHEGLIHRAIPPEIPAGQQTTLTLPPGYFGDTAIVYWRATARHITEKESEDIGAPFKLYRSDAADMTCTWPYPTAGGGIPPPDVVTRPFISELMARPFGTQTFPGITSPDAQQEYTQFTGADTPGAPYSYNSAIGDRYLFRIEQRCQIGNPRDQDKECVAIRYSIVEDNYIDRTHPAVVETLPTDVGKKWGYPDSDDPDDVFPPTIVDGNITGTQRRILMPFDTDSPRAFSWWTPAVGDFGEFGESIYAPTILNVVASPPPGEQPRLRLRATAYDADGRPSLPREIVLLGETGVAYFEVDDIVETPGGFYTGRFADASGYAPATGSTAVLDPTATSYTVTDNADNSLVGVATGQDVIFTFPGAGSYAITQTIMDTTATRVLDTHTKPEVLIPSTFTPPVYAPAFTEEEISHGGNRITNTTTGSPGAIASQTIDFGDGTTPVPTTPGDTHDVYYPEAGGTFTITLTTTPTDPAEPTHTTQTTLVVPAVDLKYYVTADILGYADPWDVPGGGDDTLNVLVNMYDQDLVKNSPPTGTRCTFDALSIAVYQTDNETNTPWTPIYNQSITQSPAWYSPFAIPTQDVPRHSINTSGGRQIHINTIATAIRLSYTYGPPDARQSKYAGLAPGADPTWYSSSLGHFTQTHAVPGCHPDIALATDPIQPGQLDSVEFDDLSVYLNGAMRIGTDWYFNGTFAFSANTSRVTADLNPYSGQVVTVGMIPRFTAVIDGTTNEGDEQMVEIQVAVPGDPPTASIAQSATLPGLDDPTVALEYTYDDPDSDIVSVVISPGDGSPDITVVTDPTGSTGTGSGTVDHAYPAGPSFTATITVTDAHGRSATDTTTVSRGPLNGSNFTPPDEPEWRWRWFPASIGSSDRTGVDEETGHLRISEEFIRLGDTSSPIAFPFEHDPSATPAHMRYLAIADDTGANWKDFTATGFNWEDETAPDHDTFAPFSYSSTYRSDATSLAVVVSQTSTPDSMDGTHLPTFEIPSGTVDNTPRIKYVSTDGLAGLTTGSNLLKFTKATVNTTDGETRILKYIGIPVHTDRDYVSFALPQPETFEITDGTSFVFRKNSHGQNPFESFGSRIFSRSTGASPKSIDFAVPSGFLSSRIAVAQAGDGQFRPDGSSGTSDHLGLIQKHVTGNLITIKSDSGLSVTATQLSGLFDSTSPNYALPSITPLGRTTP